MAGVATFTNNPKANTGITLNGSFGGGASPQIGVGTIQHAPNTIQNTAPTNNQYYLPGGGGSIGVLGASTTNSNYPVQQASGAGVGATAPDVSGYDQSIGNTNAALGRLGSQLNSGNQAIDASYQNAVNQLLLNKNQSTAAYNTNKQQTAQDYVGAKNTIGANAGQSLEGILRLLGSRGAGGSSAYNISAPGAVTREATLQRADASNTFGHNQQSLDTNYNNYLTGYNNALSSATNQRDQQKQENQAKIDNSRASLLQSLAQLQGQRSAALGGSPTGAAQPYLDQANAILNSLSNYTTKPITYDTQAYTAPTLATYTTNPNAAPVLGGGTAGTDYVSPYLAPLLGKRLQTT